MPMEGRR